MSDLIERLISLADCDARSGEPLGKVMREAAAEITRLRAAGVTEAMVKAALSAWFGSIYQPEIAMRAAITAALSARQGEECPHCGKAVSACPCENPAAAYSADMPEVAPDWVRIENEARAKDGRTLHPGPIPRSAYKNNPYADY
jgi:hypothetical protein